MSEWGRKHSAVRRAERMAGRLVTVRGVPGVGVVAEVWTDRGGQPMYRLAGHPSRVCVAADRCEAARDADAREGAA